MASLMDAFFPSTPSAPTEMQLQTAAVLGVPVSEVMPPDAPASNPAAFSKVVIDDSQNPAGDAVVVVTPPVVTPGVEVPPSIPEQPGVTASPDPKRGRGRPKGTQNAPKDLTVYRDPAPIAITTETPKASTASVAVDRVTIRHEVKIGLPGYSSAGAQIELSGTLLPGASLADAKESLSMQVKQMMIKELNVYVKNPDLTPKEQEKK